MSGMLMSGNRSTASRSSETAPSARAIRDIIRIRTGLRSARRVSHMASVPGGDGGAAAFRRPCVGAVARQGAATVRVGIARRPHLRVVGEPLDAGDHYLFVGRKPADDLEPVLAVDSDLHLAAVD